MSLGENAPDRSLYRLAGKDVLPFLQGLVSNDVLPLAKGPGLIWAALLSPQGKYQADFFVLRRAGEEDILLDLPAALAPATIRRLMMYKLRSDVQIAESPLNICRGLGETPEGGFADPRHPALGWRLYSEERGAAPSIDWEALRIEHLVPEYPNELIVEESYILEQGFERLNGVNFRKGCYVGQEVTARMKHKTELRKGLTRVKIEGTAEPLCAITLEDGREAGRLGTVKGGRALAYLRFDRAEAGLCAGAARVTKDD